MDGLSGGERRRLSLAILVASGANVLILDEPTNHLDIDAREALEDALQAFDGTVLLVSHDRALLDAVGTRTFAIEDGTLRSYPADGRSTRACARSAARPSASGRERKRATSKPKPARPEGHRAPEARRAIEERRQARRGAGARGREGRGRAARIEDELADPKAWASPTSSERATERHAEARKAVEEAYARWEAAST